MVGAYLSIGRSDCWIPPQCVRRREQHPPSLSPRHVLRWLLGLGLCRVGSHCTLEDEYEPLQEALITVTSSIVQSDRKTWAAKSCHRCVLRISIATNLCLYTQISNPYFSGESSVKVVSDYILHSLLAAADRIVPFEMGQREAFDVLDYEWLHHSALHSSFLPSKDIHDCYHTSTSNNLSFQFSSLILWL